MNFNQFHCCVAAWDPCWITKLNHKRGRMQCYQKVWHIKLYDFYRPLSSYGPSFGQNTFCMNCLYLKVKPDVFSATSNGQNIISDVRKNLHLWLNYTKICEILLWAAQNHFLALRWEIWKVHKRQIKSYCKLLPFKCN